MVAIGKNMSVIVEYDPAGRMGNRMFQYAFGYILAKLKQCDFYHDKIQNFGIERRVFSSTYNNPINTRRFGYQYADINTLVNHNGDIIVDSFVQKSSFYLNYRDDLRSLFKVNDDIINQDKLVLHVRETDYVQVNAFLGYDFYESLIKDSGFIDVIIVTDNSRSKTVQRLIASGCSLNSEGVVDRFNVTSDSRAMEDFRTLMYSENVAISQSSFSWWAAFLGNHRKVIFPYKRDISWWPVSPQEDDIDLYFDFAGTCSKYIM